MFSNSQASSQWSREEEHLDAQELLALSQGGMSQPPQDVLPPSEEGMFPAPDEMLEPPEEADLDMGAPDGAASQEAAEEKKPVKWRKLDPTSRKSLSARTCIPGAATSKQDFVAMFMGLRATWKAQTKQTHGIQIGKSYDVMVDTDHKMAAVRKHLPRWEEGHVRLGAAALHLYNRRLSDLSERDHVQLLWFALGGELLRVHEGGTVWIYQPAYGFFKCFEGLPPPHFFEVLRQFFVMLEGIFRNFEGHVKRDQKSVLDAVDKVVRDKSWEELIQRCDSACAWNKGNHLLKKATLAGIEKEFQEDAKGRADGVHPGEVDRPDDEDFHNDDDGQVFDALIGPVSQAHPQPASQQPPAELPAPAQLPPVPAVPAAQKPVQAWYIVVAQSISKVGPAVTKKLEHGKIIPFVSAWCQTPKPLRAAVAYKDAIVYYDVDGKPCKFITDEGDEGGGALVRSPSNNVYVGIERSILDDCDPVLERAAERLQKIYSETFWANIRAFVFGQACLALSKRGLNINQLTLYLGPGGVGLSKFTSHLAAMLGEENHCLFDPNIFYSDEELRKQAPNIAGHLVYTAQEKPTGTKNDIREDLLKKMLTGEGVAGRLPYGIITKLLNIIGWKRMETNKLIEFKDISEDNFESIYRRFAIIVIAARFFEGAQLTGIHLDPDTVGVFTRDPEIDAFYVSDPAIAAGLKIQAAFEEQNGLQDCRAIIQDYTNGGGDQGAGMKYLRECCGLPAVPGADATEGPEEGGDEDAAPLVTLHLGGEPARGDEGNAEKDRMKVEKISLNCVTFLKEKSLDALTPSYLAQINQEKLGVSMKRDKVWTMLAESHMWRAVLASHKATDSLMPRIQTATTFGQLFGSVDTVKNSNIPERQKGTKLNETYQLDQLLIFKGNKNLHDANTALLLSMLAAETKKLRSKKKGNWSPELAEFLEERAGKLKSNQAILGHYLQKLASGVGGEQKKRRLERKQSGAQGVCEDVEYRYTRDWRGRRQSCSSASAQRMSQYMQSLLLAHTEDFDIQNCIFEVVSQAVGKLKLHHTDHWQEEINTLNALAESRAKFCEEQLGMSATRGKAHLHTMVHGGACPRALKNQPGVGKLRALARFLRWLSTTMMPAEYDATREELKPGGGKKWAEASIAAMFYQALEDHILQAMLDYIQQKPAQHVSLHYDGVRVDKTRIEAEGGDSTHMCAALEVAVLGATGFRVKVVVKKHEVFCQMLMSCGLPQSTCVESMDCWLLKPGFGISLALSGSLSMGVVEAKLTAADKGTEYKAPGGVLTYRDVAEMLGCTLTPVLNVCDLSEGAWLLHTSMVGKPHCMAVLVEPSGEVAVHSAGTAYTTDLTRVSDMIASAMDRHNMVLFKINDVAVQQDTQLPLLDLQA